MSALSTAATWKVWRVSWASGSIGGTPTGWATVGFDDSAWDAPHAFSVYAPATPAITIAPEEAVSSTTDNGLVWLSRSPEFGLAGVPASASIDLAHDDAVEVYVNNSLVYSNGTVGNAAGVSIDQTKFVAGTNVIAVKVTNITSSNSWAVNPTLLALRVTLTFTSTVGAYADWDSDGFDIGSHDLITSNVASWSITRGASPELTGGSQPGSATILLKNPSDIYNPEYASSPIHAQLTDGVPIWIGVNDTGRLSGGSGVNGLFAGRVTDITPIPAGGATDSPHVELLCEDALGWYGRTPAKVADALDRSQADLRLAGLTAAGETRYSLPDEPRGLPLSSFDGNLASLLDGINSANGTRHFIKPADSYVDWYTYTARNRMYKVGSAADASLDAGDDHVTDTSGWRKTAAVVINEQKASITPLIFPDFRSTVWEAETLPIIVHSGQSRVIWATFDDFVTDAEVEITSTTGTTATLTSFGRTAKITLSTPPCHVTRLVITGRKVQRGLEQSVIVDDTASQAEPRGIRAGTDISGDLVGSIAAATGMATAVVWRFAQPQYRPTLTVQNWMPYQFQLDLCDLISFTSDELKVTNRLFEIVGLTHTCDLASTAVALHTTTYTLQECRQQTPKTWFTWDSSVWDGADDWAYL